MQFLLGTKVDAFPSWTGLNDILSGGTADRGAAGLTKTGSKLSARKLIRDKFTGGKFYNLERAAAMKSGIGKSQFKQQYFGDMLNYKLTEEDAKNFRLAGMRGPHVRAGTHMGTLLSTNAGISYFANQSRHLQKTENEAVTQLRELKKILEDHPSIGGATVINNIINDNKRVGGPLSDEALIINPSTNAPYGMYAQAFDFY